MAQAVGECLQVAAPRALRIAQRDPLSENQLGVRKNQKLLEVDQGSRETGGTIS